MMEQKSDDGRTGRMSLLFEVKQEGNRVSGRAGPDPSNQAPMQDLRLDGSHLTFSVTLPPPPGSDAGPTWKFDLTVSGNGMEGRSEGTMGDRSLGITQVVLTPQK